MNNLCNDDVIFGLTTTAVNNVEQSYLVIGRRTNGDYILLTKDFENANNIVVTLTANKLRRTKHSSIIMVHTHYVNLTTLKTHEWNIINASR